MAGTKYITIARKLQNACKKQYGEKLLIDQKQWYHYDKETTVTVYTLFKATGEKGKSGKVKLFQTYSQVQLVLFLRDYWYELNGWEIPHDNEKWEEIKREYGETKQTESGPTNKGSKWGIDSNRTTVRDELYSMWKHDRSGKENTESAKTE